MVSGILAVGDKLGLVVYCGISCKLGISGIAAVSKHGTISRVLAWEVVYTMIPRSPTQFFHHINHPHTDQMLQANNIGTCIVHNWILFYHWYKMW